MSWDLGLDKASWFSELIKARPVVCSGVLHMMGSDEKIRIERNCVSLLMLKNLKLKKVNKSFVPEPILCFSDSYMRMNIMNVLCMWISWSYFWTWICYRWADMLCIASLHLWFENHTGECAILSYLGSYALWVWAIILQEQLKTLIVQKVNAELITVQ